MDIFDISKQPNGIKNVSVFLSAIIIPVGNVEPQTKHYTSTIFIIEISSMNVWLILSPSVRIAIKGFTRNEQKL